MSLTTLSFGYSADTSFDPNLIEWLSDTCLFFHETNLGTHTSSSDLEKLPEKIRSKIQLVHYPDSHDVEKSVIPCVKEGCPVTYVDSSITLHRGLSPFQIRSLTTTEPDTIRKTPGSNYMREHLLKIVFCSRKKHSTKSQSAASLATIERHSRISKSKSNYPKEELKGD